MKRVLLFATTTGYQTRAFGEAAERLDVELVFATDRCHMLEDPWQDRAIPVRFYDPQGSVDAVLQYARSSAVSGILAVGDRPTVIAAAAARALGLPGHPPEAAATASNKLRTRTVLRDKGLPAPWFRPISLEDDPAALADTLSFPAVVKPVALSGSRGVMRVDDPVSCVAALERLRALLRSPEIRAERDEAHEIALVEGFIPGREYALEGLMHDGELATLAIFDKPDPLDGPFFEETIYVTPSRAAEDVQRVLVSRVAAAAAAIGLHHGPIHAEARVAPDDVYVLEVAARPIGGLCARALTFRDPSPKPKFRGRVSLEELLLRHAIGESPHRWTREAAASGVMMIPIERRGILRRADGAADARLVPGVDDVRITAKTDQLLVPLPEGASYLGFIFAHGDRPADVESALRAAHARLRFTIDPGMPVLYNRSHG